MVAAGYDEFSLLEENATEAGLAWSGPPAVRREVVAVGSQPERRLSAIVWGAGEPEMVLVHGAAQNAHTWDTVALALTRPLVALDLPGHGHSDWRPDHDYSPATNAAAVAVAVAELAPAAALVVGMSLGGLTAIRMSAIRPELVRRLALVDITPGTDRAEVEPILAFVSSPEVFASFDEILRRAIAFNPNRTESSLRRGILHNARPREDGSWVWRYDRGWADGPGSGRSTRPEPSDLGHAPLWADLSRLAAPLLLVRGRLSQVVSDDDVAELRRRQPRARIETVDGAGHSVQGDRPVELARLLAEFVATTP